MGRVAKINRLHFIRAYLLGAGTFIGLFSLLLPRRNRIIFNSTVNRYYNFNTKYLFEYFLEKKVHPVYFVVDDNELRAKLIQKHGNHFISSSGLRNKLFILCSRIWVTSTMETPVGGILLSLRRFVYHLGHGVPVKKAGGAEQSVRWYKKMYYFLVETNFSAFLSPTLKASTRYQQVYGCRSHKMVINPQPRLSIMFADKPLMKTAYRVLYAPTWRNLDSVKLFPFADYSEELLLAALEEMDVEICLHPHPIRSAVDFSGVQSPRLKVVFDRPGEDVNQYLSHYDLLVTDYSSIFVEFLALKRPVIFVPYDYSDFGKNIGMFDFEGDLSTGPNVHTQKDFVLALRNFIQGIDTYQEKRVRVSEELNGHQLKDACEVNYQYLISKLDN